MRNLARALLLGLAAVTSAGARGDQAAPSVPPAPAPAGDIEDFVPSEKVSADDAVAFPVDI